MIGDKKSFEKLPKSTVKFIIAKWKNMASRRYRLSVQIEFITREVSKMPATTLKESQSSLAEIGEPV